MIAEIENHIIDTLHIIFDRFNWLGVAGLLAFENATGIIPSEILLGMAGWMLLAFHDAPPAMIFVGGLIAALGSVTGSSVTYWLVRLGGRPALDLIIRWLRIKPSHIQRSEMLFRRWGPGLILFGRVVPGIRTLITIPAGLARMPYPQFLAFTFIGAYIWCTAMIGLGFFIGHEWHLISGIIRGIASWAWVGLLTLLILVLTGRWIIQRRLRTQPMFIKKDIEKVRRV